MRGGNTLFQSCRGSAQVSSSQWLPHPQRPQSLAWLLHCGLEVEGRDKVQTTTSAFGVFPTRPGLEMASITPPHLLARPYICGPPNCKGGWEISSRKERGWWVNKEPVSPTVAGVEYSHGLLPSPSGTKWGILDSIHLFLQLWLTQEKHGNTVSMSLPNCKLHWAGRERSFYFLGSESFHKHGREGLSEGRN